MYQNPYLNYENEINGVENIAPYPSATLLGGNESLTRPRPMYNMMPESNLPSYSLNMNSNINRRPYDNVNNNYANKKFNRVIGDILESRKDRLNDIIIIIL